MANLGHLKIKNAPKAFAQYAERHNELVGLIESLEGQLGIDIQIAHTPKQKIKMPPGVAQPRARPRGKILVSAVPTGLDGYLTASGATGGGNANIGGTIQAVGVNGQLYDVLQPSSPNAVTNYPVLLGTVTGTKVVTIANAGIIVQDTANPRRVEIGAFSGFGQGSVRVFNTNTHYVAIEAGNVTTANGSAQVDIGNGSVQSTDGSGASGRLQTKRLTMTNSAATSLTSAESYASTSGSNTAIVSGETGLYLANAGFSLTLPFGGITHDMTIKTISVCVNGNAMSMLVLASDPF
jgi:hypothetical protein